MRRRTMGSNAPYDPGGGYVYYQLTTEDGTPINPPRLLCAVYNQTREYREDGLVETTPTQEGLTLYGQARITPNNTRIVDDTDGSQSMAYGVNHVVHSQEDVNHLPFPVQAMPSDESSDSSDEATGNNEPYALRMDNQQLSIPGTSIHDANRGRTDVRAETNWQSNNQMESRLVASSNGQQSHSRFTPRTQQLEQNRDADIQGTEQRIPHPVSLHASLSMRIGANVYLKKWNTCKQSFQNIRHVNAEKFADQLICFTNVANQVKCLECKSCCDMNVTFDHKPHCVVAKCIASSFPDAVEDESEINETGPQAQGATGYTPTLVPPSVEGDELLRNNGERNTANSGHGYRPSVTQASADLHSEDTRQRQAQLLEYIPETCSQLGDGHVTTVKRRLPPERQGATGYTPDGQPRGKPKKKTSQGSFDIHHIAQPPTMPQFEEILSQGTQGINNVSSARTTRPSVTDNNGAEAFLMRAGYELCDIQDYKQSHGLREIDFKDVEGFVDYMAKRI